MTINRIRQYFTLLLLALSLFGCRKKEVISEDLQIPGLGGTTEIQNELDEWLYDNFTKPYNIEVVYRWDAAQMYTSVDSKLVPVDYDAVQPMMAILRDVWFEPFNDVLGEDIFLKKYAPKKVVLVGSPEYVNGAIKLGQAEGGRKILLLNANRFNPKDVDLMKNMLQTIVHEFAHILHQMHLFTPQYQEVSKGFYDSTGWNQYPSEGEAYVRGFVSRYAMSDYHEDFVETFAILMVRGREWFESTVIPVARNSKITNAEAALRTKISLVEEYMMSNFGIRMFDDPATGELGLETYMQNAINQVILTPPTE